EPCQEICVTPDRFLIDVIDDGLRLLATLNGPQPSDDARRFMLTIAQQESALQMRYQKGASPNQPGPARGWWQFEQGGGVAGVLGHPSTQQFARSVCAALDVEPFPASVYRALEGHDDLSPCFARLLIYTDPHPLPTNAVEGWDCYVRLWRP